MVGEPVDGRPDGGDPAAVAGNVADEPVLSDGGRQCGAERLSHPVDGDRCVAGGQLQARERVEFSHGELPDLAVPEFGDEVVLDDHPVVRERGPCERPAAGFALGCFDGEPPAELVVEPLVRDGFGELNVLRPLPSDPGLGMLPRVEGPAATDTTAAGIAAEADRRLESSAARDDGASSASSPYPPSWCHGVPPIGTGSTVGSGVRR